LKEYSMAQKPTDDTPSTLFVHSQPSKTAQVNVVGLGAVPSKWMSTNYAIGDPSNITVSPQVYGTVFGSHSIVDDRATTELRRQIDKLSQQLEDLRRQPKPDAELRNRVEELQSSLNAVREAGQQVTAPVYMPAPEDMAVRLVSAGSLDSLEEYQNDWGVCLALFGVFAGLTGGLALAPVVSPSTNLSKGYWLLLACLIVVTLIFGGWGWVVRRRVRGLQSRMLGTVPKPAKPAGDVTANALIGEPK
jgi:hypothetical protein